MADGITITGGGSFAVATDELYRLAQTLEWIRDESAAAQATLYGLFTAQPFGPLVGMDSDVYNASSACRTAALELGWIEFEAGSNAFALRASAEVYGFTDRAIASALEQLAGVLAYGAGALAPVLLLNGLTGVFLGMGLGLVLLAATNGGPAGVAPAVQSWLTENRHLLNNPVTVELVRLALTSADEMAAGALKVPYSYSEAAEVVGLAGISSSALVAILAGNRAGLFTETPVSVRKTTTSRSTQPPQGLAERIERLPDPKRNASGEQIRIDRYDVPGQPDRFDVYIAGTVDFSPLASGEPFDLTSNFHGMADLPAGSYRGVEDALRQAGVTEANPIVFTGHSQGGLLAETLARSGNYNTLGVVTIGAPTGHISAPASFPVIAMEHTEDIVPALGGSHRDSATFVVRRAALADGSLPEGIFFPAHERTEYAQTARMADEASNRSLREAIATIDTVSAGARRTESTTWMATRQH